jgi:hypothetical protein
MNQLQEIPNETTRNRLLVNLRQTRLDLQEFGLQLEEILAHLDKDIRQQKIQRLNQKKQLIRKTNL